MIMYHLEKFSRAAGTVLVGAKVEVGIAVMVCTSAVEAAASAVSWIGVVSLVVLGESVTQEIKNTM